MAEILERLREDHRNMRRLLKLFEGQVATLRNGEAADLDLMTQAIDYCLTYPDLYHHPKEDQLYRRLVEKGISQYQVSDMEKAHEDLAGLTRRLAAALDEVVKAPDRDREEVAELAQSFLDGYRLHMEAEDMTFFPLAEERFEAADWQAIEQELARMNDPLFSERSAEAYRRLNRNLTEMDQRAAAG